MIKDGRDFPQNISRKYDGETLEGVQSSSAYFWAPRSFLAVKVMFK